MTINKKQSNKFGSDAATVDAATVDAATVDADAHSTDRSPSPTTDGAVAPDQVAADLNQQRKAALENIEKLRATFTEELNQLDNYGSNNSNNNASLNNSQFPEKGSEGEYNKNSLQYAFFFIFCIRMSLLCILLGFVYYAYIIWWLKPWGNDITDKNVKNKEDLDSQASLRGTLTSALSVIIVNGLGAILNSDPKFNKSIYTVNLGFIFSNIFGYLLDQLFGVAEGHKLYADADYEDRLKKDDEELGFKNEEHITKVHQKRKNDYIAERFSRKPFFRFMVTVLLDMFISEPIQDSLKYTINLSGAKDILRYIEESQSKRNDLEKKTTKINWESELDIITDEFLNDIQKNNLYDNDEALKILKEYKNQVGILPKPTFYRTKFCSWISDKFFSTKLKNKNTVDDLQRNLIDKRETRNGVVSKLSGEIDPLNEETKGDDFSTYEVPYNNSFLKFFFIILKSLLFFLFYIVDLITTPIGIPNLIAWSSNPGIFGANDAMLSQNFDSILQSIVAIITFFAYTNQTRFYWAYPGPETDRISDETIQLAFALSIALYFSFAINTPSNPDNNYNVRSASDKITRLLFSVVGIGLCSAIGFGMINPPKKLTYDNNESVTLEETYKRIKNDPTRSEKFNNLHSKQWTIINTHMILSNNYEGLFSLTDDEREDQGKLDDVSKKITELDTILLNKMKDIDNLVTVSSSTDIFSDNKWNEEHIKRFAELWEDNNGTTFLEKLFNDSSSNTSEESILISETGNVVLIDAIGRLPNIKANKPDDDGFVKITALRSGDAAWPSKMLLFERLSIKGLEDLYKKGFTEEVDTIFNKLIDKFSGYNQHYTANDNSTILKWLLEIRSEIKEKIEIESLKLKQNKEEILFAGKNKTYGIMFITMLLMAVLYMCLSHLFNVTSWPIFLHAILLITVGGAFYTFTRTSTDLTQLTDREVKNSDSLYIENMVAVAVGIFVFIYCIIIPFTYYKIEERKLNDFSPNWPTKWPKWPTRRRGQSDDAEGGLIEGAEGAERKMDFAAIRAALSEDLSAVDLDKINTHIKDKLEKTITGDITDENKDEIIDILGPYAGKIKNFLVDSLNKQEKPQDKQKVVAVATNVKKTIFDFFQETIENKGNIVDKAFGDLINLTEQNELAPEETGAFGKKKKSKKSKKSK
tara:strand:- start:7757 stop:11218 length:3462 start_codon:yes stop_codon:yes gene_type:complete